MGTRSRIAVMHGEVCKSVYCHWDGYLEHNGAILQEHYDSSKANQLVAMGDLSSLRPEIGVKHPFSCRIPRLVVITNNAMATCVPFMIATAAKQIALGQ